MGTLFLLGVDSAFSMVEATATVVADIPSLKKVPRMLIAFIICMAGFIMSIPFCTNWGFVLFDVIDHYLCTYLLLLVGIFQCVGCGWGFDVERTLRISEKHALSLKYLTGSFWGFLFVVGLVFVLLEQKSVCVGAERLPTQCQSSVENPSTKYSGGNKHLFSTLVLLSSISFHASSGLFL